MADGYNGPKINLFDQTDESGISESDPEETEFEKEFLDINRRRSIRKHKGNTLSPTSPKVDYVSDMSLSPGTPRSNTVAGKMSVHSHKSPTTVPTSRISEIDVDELSGSDSEEPLFTAPPSSHLLCNICGRVLRRPVITTCGHTYCARCVLVSQSRQCPIDGTPLSLVLENIALRDQIGALIAYCRFGCALSNTGEKVFTGQACTDKITFNELRFHESQCPWSIVQCPNSTSCGTLLSKDLSEHLFECTNAKCRNQEFGCDVLGTAPQMEEHLSSCKFNVVRQVIESFKATVDGLVVEVRKQGKQLKEFSKVVAKLQADFNQRERLSDGRFSSLEESRVHYEGSLNETREMLNEMSNEMNSIQLQLGIVGNIESHVYKCKGTFVGHEGPIWSMVSWGHLLFSGSSDHTIKVWDTLANFTCLKTLHGHEGMVLSLCVNNGLLYSSASDSMICIWDIKTYQLVDTVTAHTNPICTLAANDKYLFTGSLRIIKVWDKTTLQTYRTLEGLNHWVRALVISNNKMFAGIYQAIKIWNTDTFECERVIDIKGGSVYSMVVTESRIICGTYDKGIFIQSLTNPRDTEVLKGHSGTVYCLGYLKSGGHTRLFSGAYDRTIKVWNLDKKIGLQTMDRHQGSVCCIVIARGKIFSGAMDSTIKVWQ